MGVEGHELDDEPTRCAVTVTVRSRRERGDRALRVAVWSPPPVVSTTTEQQDDQHDQNNGCERHRFLLLPAICNSRAVGAPESPPTATPRTPIARACPLLVHAHCPCTPIARARPLQ